MEQKMKDYLITGLAALCLMLGLIAALGGSWLVPDLSDEEQEQMDEAGMEGGIGLTHQWTSVEMTNASTCESVLDTANDHDQDHEYDCDGKVLTTTISLSSVCEITEESGSDDTTVCELNTAGTVGSVGMWGGIICAFLIVLKLILPMAGVSALEEMPANVKMIIGWCAGSLMLIGITAWYVMLPDEDTMQAGMSVFLAIAAALLGLGAQGASQFIPAGSNGPAE